MEDFHAPSLTSHRHLHLKDSWSKHNEEAFMPRSGQRVSKATKALCKVFQGKGRGTAILKGVLFWNAFMYSIFSVSRSSKAPSWCWSTWTSTKTQLRVRSLIASVHHGLMTLCSGTWKAYYLFMKGHVYRLVNNADKFHLITTINFSSASCISSKWLMFGIACANGGSHRTR